MQVYHRLEEVAPHLKRSAVAIGNFDGVHLGHAALLGNAVKSARANGSSAVVLTFFPHPVEVLKPGTKLMRLTTASEKLVLLERLGLDFVLVERFDEKLAALSPSDFFQRYLAAGLKAHDIHVGFNFYFGKGRTGNTDVLKTLCTPAGIRVHIEQPFQKDGVKVDSTTIRGLVSEGQVTRATELLGRPYEILGQVAHGDHRGTGLGFPTANLHPPDEKILPRNGVYVTRVHWQRQIFRSVTNVGIRPTFVDGQTVQRPRVEVHLLDFSARLYDEFLQVDFLERIRDEMKFDSVDALKAQIERDVSYARACKVF